jgi:hypothetical protein
LKFPKNWRDCKPFVKALLKREYLSQDSEGELHLSMSDGIYLYLYELWQDGVVRPSGST